VLQVGAWEARGRLPLGAEVTACLHGIQDRDAAACAAAGRQPEPEALLRLQYAMALIRLVNGISDSSQKGRLALSVAQLAHDAGLRPPNPP
jgi:ribosomal biogenesis protein LAS1